MHSSVFAERIPLRITRQCSVTVHPGAIVLKKKHAEHQEHVLTLASSHTFRSITHLQGPAPTNARITVDPGESLHQSFVRIETLSPGVLSHLLCFKVLVEDRSGALIEESLRVPVVGRL